MAFPSVARELWPRETSDLRFRRDSSQQASDLSAQLLARAKGPYFNGGSGPTSNPLYYGHATFLEIKHIDNQALHRFQHSEQLFRQLTRGEFTIGGKGLIRSGEIFQHGCLLFAQIGVTQFRPRFFRHQLIAAGIDRDARNPVRNWHLAGILRQVLENFYEN